MLAICLALAVGQTDEQYDPVYLGRFEQPIHSVAGDIFILDEKSIYIQDFAHDGQAPDVFFWEDVVLMLPNGMTVFDIRQLSVWCRAFGISFGHIDFPTLSKIICPCVSNHD